MVHRSLTKLTVKLLLVAEQLDPVSNDGIPLLPHEPFCRATANDRKSTIIHSFKPKLSHLFDPHFGRMGRRDRIERMFCPPNADH